MYTVGNNCNGAVVCAESVRRHEWLGALLRSHGSNVLMETINAGAVALLNQMTVY